MGSMTGFIVCLVNFYFFLSSEAWLLSIPTSALGIQSPASDALLRKCSMQDKGLMFWNGEGPMILFVVVFRLRDCATLFV